MVAQGYYNARIVGLLVSGICVFITTSQIIVFHYKPRKSSDLKYYIHYACFLCVFCTFIGFIDIDGFFGLIPYLAVDLINNIIGTRGIMIAFSLVVVGHFQAHYTTLKKETPRFFAWFFGISIVINTIAASSCLIGYYYTQNYSYETLLSGFQLLWLISMLIVDLIGYYLVRKLFHALQHFQCSPPSPTIHSGPTDVESQVPLATPSSKDGKLFHSAFDYDQFLQRLRRFHFFFTLFSIFFILMELISFASKPTPPLPDTFSISGDIYQPYLYLAMWTWLTWWAWIPLKVKDDISSKTNMSSHRKATVNEPGSHNLELAPARNEVDHISVSGLSDLVHNPESPSGRSQSDQILTLREEESASGSGEVLLVGITEDGGIVSRQDN